MNIRVKGDIVEIEGYVNAVERKSKILHDRFGEFVERIKVGAFAKALEDNKDVRILLNHDWDRELGGQKDGNLELNEDAIGLHVRATIEDKEVANDARNNNLVGWSFGFFDVDVKRTEEEGFPVRNVYALELMEVSLLNRKAIPAYDGTLVNVRSEGEKAILMGDINECDFNIEVAEERAEEKTEEQPENDNDNEPAEIGAVDYTQYKKIIEEMKGD